MIKISLQVNNVCCLQSYHNHNITVETGFWLYDNISIKSVQTLVNFLCPFCKLHGCCEISLTFSKAIPSLGNGYTMAVWVWRHHLCTQSTSVSTCTCVPRIPAAGPRNLSTKGRKQVEESPRLDDNIRHGSVCDHNLGSVTNTWGDRQVTSNDGTTLQNGC